MSCLILSDLSLTDQIAIELAWAEKLAARAAAAIKFLDAPATTPLTPCGASAYTDTGASLFSQPEAIA